MEESALIQYQSPAIVAGSWGNLSMVFYRSPPTTQELLDVDGLNDAIVAAYPSGYALLGFVDPLQKIPSAEIRAVSAKILKRRANVQRLTVLVLEGTGFWASAMRMAITSIIGMVSGQGTRRFAKDVPEAAEILRSFVHERDGTPVPRQQIEEAVQSFRRKC